MRLPDALRCASPFVSMLLFASCFASAPVYRLTPLSPNSIWRYGQEVVSLQDSVVDVAVSFSDTYEGGLVFDVEVENLTEHPVLISPEQFCAIPLTEIQDTALKKGVPIFHAQDPERRIESVDLRKSREQASYENANAIDAVGSMIGLIGSIASIGESKTDEQREKEKQWEDRQTNDRVERDISHANAVRQFEDERRIWGTDALRKTTLLPGQILRGEIHVATLVNSRLVQLLVTVDGTTRRFLFNQEKI